MGTLFAQIAESAAKPDLQASVHSVALTVVGWAAVTLILLVAIAIWAQSRNFAKLKPILFTCISIVVIITTSVLIGGAVYLNSKSYVGGPVHWHADFEIWACGNQLDLRDPQGLLSNKIGTATLHEHNDKRIHLEGVPITPYDASLGKFMTVVGGHISNNALVVPLNSASNRLFAQQQNTTMLTAPSPELVQPYIFNEGSGNMARFINGNLCGNEPSEVQVFVYQANHAAKTYRQIKLNNPANYSISQHSDVPPGDCIIIEFGPKSERTQRLCQQYGVRDYKQCQNFGVDATQRESCNYREVQ